MIKYSRHFLSKLENLFAESDYVLRYEKGSFKSGYCLLKDTKIAIINKYYTQEGKITCIIDILKEIQLNTSKFTDTNKKFYSELQQTTLEL